MRKKKQTRTLTKLTSVETGKPIWIDTEEIIGVEAEYPVPEFIYTRHNGNNVNQYIGTTTTVSVAIPTCTRITLVAGNMFMVSEHHLEVLALSEGRSAAPAQIIYGRKS